MNSITFTLAGEKLSALGSGALYLPAANTLCISDMHLGRADHVARDAGPLLPPFENQAVLEQLDQDLRQTGAQRVVALGDSFDDVTAAQALDQSSQTLLAELQTGREWIWVEGNHDPGPTGFSGQHIPEWHWRGLTLRHIAQPGARAEISGHYHPKHSVTGRGRKRPCFAFDRNRLIMPAYGTYTGGLAVASPAIATLLASPVFAILTGKVPLLVPISATIPGAKLSNFSRL
ncbi:MAG: ligase-associated DNA damage response endonuclease PdeM [Rhodobacteraceae bacterium]|nr:ligase-associated DNA damage response endonuclease PdeM [Paracoccaceae bacterium]